MTAAKADLTAAQADLTAAQADVSAFENIIVAESSVSISSRCIDAVLEDVKLVDGGDSTSVMVLQAMLDTHHFDPNVLLDVLGYAADSSELRDQVKRLADIETELASQFSSWASETMTDDNVKAAIEALDAFKTQLAGIQTSVFNDRK